MDVLYVGPYRQNDEWGYTSKAFAQLLSNQEINLVTRPIWFNNEIMAVDVEAIEPYEFNTLDNYDVLIQHGLPSALNYNGDFKRNIAITSVDCIVANTDWVTHLNLFDEIVVFSEYEKQLLIDSQVTSNIIAFKFPPLFFNPAKNDLNLNFQGTKFYTTGSLDIKSGLRETIAAYLSSFSILDNVILILATTDGDAVEKEIMNLKVALGIFGDARYYPNIAVVSNNSAPILNYLHEYCDVFVHVPYNMRIGQELLRAISFNSIPAILRTPNSLFDESYPFMVECNNDLAIYPQRPLPLLYTAEYDWLTPNIMSLSSTMLQIHSTTNFDETQQYLASIKSKLISHPDSIIKQLLCIQ